MASPTTIAQKRNSMFAVLGSNNVWDKKSITTLIFALLDAIAKEFGNLQDATDEAKNDLHLSTVTRIDNLQAMWGDMLKETLQQDLNFSQQVGVWANLLKRIITGTEISGITYEASSKNNIQQLILDYSLVEECKIFEFWNNAGSFAGASVINNALKWNDTARMWNEDALHSVWLDIDTLKALAYLVAGFQIFPVINNYTRDTAIIEYAAHILSPFHNIIGIVWMTDLVTMPVGTAAVATFVRVGTGTGVGPDCAIPLADSPAINDNINTSRRVVSGSSAFKRSLAIITKAALPAAAEVTEMCLLDSFSNPIVGSYRTIPAIHKKANVPLAIGFYYEEV